MHSWQKLLPGGSHRGRLRVFGWNGSLQAVWGLQEVRESSGNASPFGHGESLQLVRDPRVG